MITNELHWSTTISAYFFKDYTRARHISAFSNEEYITEQQIMQIIMKITLGAAWFSTIPIQTTLEAMDY